MPIANRRQCGDAAQRRALVSTEIKEALDRAYPARGFHSSSRFLRSSSSVRLRTFKVPPDASAASSAAQNECRSLLAARVEAATVLRDCEARTVDLARTSLVTKLRDQFIDLRHCRPRAIKRPSPNAQNRLLSAARIDQVRRLNP